MRLKFGSKEFCKALVKLGCKPEKQHGTSHQKYNIPKNKRVIGLRPFIEVVHGRKQYFPPTVVGYLRQLKQFGYTEEEIIKAFSKK